jgi:hypothetical protein
MQVKFKLVFRLAQLSIKQRLLAQFLCKLRGFAFARCMEINPNIMKILAYAKISILDWFAVNRRRATHQQPNTVEQAGARKIEIVKSFFHVVIIVKSSQIYSVNQGLIK